MILVHNCNNMIFYTHIGKVWFYKLGCNCIFTPRREYVIQGMRDLAWPKNGISQENKLNTVVADDLSPGIGSLNISDNLMEMIEYISRFPENNWAGKGNHSHEWSNAISMTDGCNNQYIPQIQQHSTKYLWRHRWLIASHSFLLTGPWEIWMWF